MKKIIAFFYLFICVNIFAQSNHQLWVGQSLTCDVSSYVMGSTSDMTWSVSPSGLLSLSGSGFYREAKTTSYFSGTATVKCSWYYTLTYGGTRKYQEKTWSISCLDNPASISPKHMYMTVGGATGQVTCTLKYSNQYSSYADIYYETSDPNIAVVDHYTGEVFAKSVGTTYIYAYSNVSANSPYCTVTVNPAAAPTSISLSESSLSLEAGTSGTLTCSFLPTNAYSTVTWSSSNTSVATVTLSGTTVNVNAKNVGSTTITATTANGCTATCLVNVTPPPPLPDSFTLSATSLTLVEGESESLSPIFSPSGSSANITWSSNKTSVATVNANGKVSAISNGSCVITGRTSNGLSAQCVVTVEKKIVATKITIDLDSANIKLGGGLLIPYDITPYNANAGFSLSSSNPSVAIATFQGKLILVQSISLGTTVITARTSNGYTDSFRVRIISASTIQPTSISLSPTSISLEVGKTKNLTATLSPSNATTTITWSSSNASVATVSTSGVVTAVSAGSATITATTSNGLTATCAVNVNNTTTSIPATSFKLLSSSITMNENETTILSASIAPSNTTSTVTWTSSNTNVAYISQSVNTGAEIISRAAGTAIITATTENGLSGVCTINVTTDPLPTRIYLSSTSMTLDVGDTEYLYATFTPEGTSLPIEWISYNTSVATVDQDGMVTAVSAGTAVIRAETDNFLVASCTVTVTDDTPSLPTSISLSPTSMTLEVGASKYIYETFYPEGSSANITWSSNKTSVATVSSAGKVTAVSAGSATITARTSNGKSATCAVTVTSSSSTTQPTSISLSPTSMSLEVGGTKTITYTLTPSTATTTVTWSSSNTSVATVSSAGKVTAVSAGSATITARTSNGKTATCAVTVTSSQPTSISLSPTSMSLEVGGTKTITYTLTPSTATTTVTWSSSNTSVATVSSAGKVTAVSAGSATITASTSNEKTATCAVIVEYPSDTCGADMTWELQDSVLTIRGIGTMKNYSSSHYAPWYSQRSSIKLIYIHNGCTSIGNYAFYDCSSLTSIVIPNSITDIGNHAFHYCSNLTSVVIPNSVTNIRDNAFYSAVKSLTCYATIPPTVTSYAFSNISIFSCMLYVPASSVSAYRAASYWKTFTNILSIDANDLEIYEAYQTSLVAICDSIAEDVDSEAVLEMIENATAIILSIMYDPGKSMEENKAVLDAIIDQLRKYIYAEQHEDFENIYPHHALQKIIMDNHLYILYGNQIYTPHGQLVK